MKLHSIKFVGTLFIGGILFVSTAGAQEQLRERRAEPTPTPSASAVSPKTNDSANAATAAKQTSAQTSDAKQASDAKTKDAAPTTTAKQSKDAKPSKDEKSASDAKQSGDAKSAKSQDIPAEILANRHEDASEEAAAIVPYYNNFLSSYRLGPEDVISITVFGQPNYSKQGIVVPPDGKVSYYLIPEGIFVAGKTVQQVQDELTKRLDEYIIDPKVTVSLDKAQSTRYAVIGDVVHPGIRLMTRRLSLTEAISEAGGILQTGNKKKVVLLRRQNDNSVAATTINVDAIMRGRAPDNIFLVPGDQIIVPGNRIKTLQTIFGMAQILSFARTFAPGY
jgi:polysaccharide export outer membrane protein